MTDNFSSQHFNYFQNLGLIFDKISVTSENQKSTPLNEALEYLIQKAVSTHQKGKKIIFIGNGGSSAIASHMAIDYWKNGGLRAITFNDPAQITCLSNDYGYEHVFSKPIQMFAESGDLMFAISSSGKSPNILNAVHAGKAKGCEIITLSGFSPDNPLKKLGSINFYVPSDSYGYVEITHLVICHAIVDLSMKRNTAELK